MSDDKLIRFVTRHLNIGAASVTRQQGEKLKVARTRALEHQTKRSEARLAGVADWVHNDFFARRSLFWVFALLIMTISAAYWHAQNYIVELEEVDSAILIDEMPMDIITDRGFDTWLKSPAAR